MHAQAYIAYAPPYFGQMALQAAALCPVFCTLAGPSMWERGVQRACWGCLQE